MKKVCECGETFVTKGNARRCDSCRVCVVNGCHKLSRRNKMCQRHDSLSRYRAKQSNRQCVIESCLGSIPSGGEKYCLAHRKSAENERKAAYRRKRRARGNESISITEVVNLYGCRCLICNFNVDMTLKYPDYMSPSIEHLVPVSLGGTHELENLRVSHWWCNIMRNRNPEMVFMGESVNLKSKTLKNFESKSVYKFLPLVISPKIRLWVIGDFMFHEMRDAWIERYGDDAV